jgi:hypothetical protein
MPPSAASQCTPAYPALGELLLAKIRPAHQAFIVMWVTCERPVGPCLVAAMFGCPPATLASIPMNASSVASIRKVVVLFAAILLAEAMFVAGGSAATPIGLAKRLASVDNNGDGTYAVVYELLVQNYSTSPLQAIQVEDDLGNAFSYPATCNFALAESESFTINELYDGDDDIALLEGTDTLDAGESASITLRLCFSPQSGVTRYENQAIASAVDEAGNEVADRSQRGHNPDPDGDGDPGNNAEPTGLAFPEFELGGSLSMSVEWVESSGFEFSGTTLNAFLSIEGFTAQVATSLVDTGMDSFSIQANGTLGEVRANSALTFDPSTVSFKSWQGGAAFSLLDVDVTSITYLGTPQTASYTQFSGVGPAGPFEIQASIRISICPLLFTSTNLCATWDWPDCDTSVSACMLVVADSGFESLAFTLSDLVLYEDLLGVRWSLDTVLSFTPEEKSLVPTLKLQPDWLICPEIRLLGEVTAGAGIASASASLIYGIQGECSIGESTVFRFAESLSSDKNSSVTGKADYFEVLGVSGGLLSCCGSEGSFDIAAYFDADSTSLFDLGLFAMSFETQIAKSLAVSFGAEFPADGSDWKLATTFDVTW